MLSTVENPWKTDRLIVEHEFQRGLEYIEQIAPSSGDDGSIPVDQESNKGSERKYQDVKRKEKKQGKIVYVEAAGVGSRKV